ncbi:hypothetical protein HGRIS_012841 [Hohenbuehelia grisea]|uniref:JmjC domain-containing protein n=1 Tax=Hohenbuehelia grisea TaxID=104357 RepID=A0ABR3ITK3_9AGAR
MHSHPTRDKLQTTAPFFTAQGWTLENLLARSTNFQRVPRISVASPELDAQLQEYEHHCIPLIVQELHQLESWRPELFTAEWLVEHGPPNIRTRNIRNYSDAELPTQSFIAKLRQTPTHSTPEETERLYGKDVDCPPEWNIWLHQSGCVPELLHPDGPDNLMMNLPKQAQVETLMCYVGVGDTYTPCHKDLCASSGHNLMCHTENGGSSFWFMTDGSDAAEVAAYFRKLHQELDHETHVISVDELAKAPFKVYIAEQLLGDLVLVPPRSCHQVVNQGGITIKTSWSRMTLKGLSTALFQELPVYHRVCRPETYRIKSTIHHTLLKKTSTLVDILPEMAHRPVRAVSVVYGKAEPRPPQASSILHDSVSRLKSRCFDVANELKELLRLFRAILHEEYADDWASMKILTVSSSPTDPSSPQSSPHERYCAEEGYLSCDFCGADIFQSYFECSICSCDLGKEAGPGVFICPGCYVEGRSCRCEVMTPGLCFGFDELHQDLARAEDALRLYHTQAQMQVTLDNDSAIMTRLFQAACTLHANRKAQKRISRACRFRGSSESHAVPPSEALNCKQCHSSQCFMHLLDDEKIHITQALFLHGEDKEHLAYHTAQRQGKHDFERSSTALILASKQGSSPPRSHQLVQLALMYKTCKPINVRCMKTGFYDDRVEMHEPFINSLDDAGAMEEESSAPSPSQTSSPSPLFSAPGSISEPPSSEKPEFAPGLRAEPRCPSPCPKPPMVFLDVFMPDLFDVYPPRIGPPKEAKTDKLQTARGPEEMSQPVGPPTGVKRKVKKDSKRQDPPKRIAKKRGRPPLHASSSGTTIPGKHTNASASASAIEQVSAGPSGSAAFREESQKKRQAIANIRFKKIKPAETNNPTNGTFSECLASTYNQASENNLKGYDTEPGESSDEANAPTLDADPNGSGRISLSDDPAALEQPVVAVDLAPWRKPHLLLEAVISGENSLVESTPPVLILQAPLDSNFEHLVDQSPPQGLEGHPASGTLSAQGCPIPGGYGPISGHAVVQPEPRLPAYTSQPATQIRQLGPPRSNVSRPYGNMHGPANPYNWTHQLTAAPQQGRGSQQSRHPSAYRSYVSRNRNFHQNQRERHGDQNRRLHPPGPPSSPLNGRERMPQGTWCNAVQGTQRGSGWHEGGPDYHRTRANSSGSYAGHSQQRPYWPPYGPSHHGTPSSGEFVQGSSRGGHGRRDDHWQANKRRRSDGPDMYRDFEHPDTRSASLMHRMPSHSTPNNGGHVSLREPSPRRQHYNSTGDDDELLLTDVSSTRDASSHVNQMPDAS